MNRTYSRLSRRSLLLLSLGATAAWAQGGWPKARPLRILVGFTAGSATDVMARTVAPELSRLLGTPVIVENKPGAGGAIATAQMVQAPADGYTIVLNSSAHAVNPVFNPHLPFDTLRDVSAIGPLGTSLFVMVVAPERGYRSVADVIARAKAQPGKLNYGSGGIGTGSHLNSAKLVAATGIDVVHIPSKGTPEAMVDTIAGRLDWVFSPAPAAVPLIREGKLQALAVGPATRSLALPSTPSMAEAGFPEAAYASWVALFASAKTPRPIVEELNTALAEVVALPAVSERLLALGTEPMPMTAPQFDRFVAGEIKAMQQLVKKAKIQLQT